MRVLTKDFQIIKLQCKQSTFRIDRKGCILTYDPSNGRYQKAQRRKNFPVIVDEEGNTNFVSTSSRRSMIQANEVFYQNKAGKKYFNPDQCCFLEACFRALLKGVPDHTPALEELNRRGRLLNKILEESSVKFSSPHWQTYEKLLHDSFHDVERGLMMLSTPSLDKTYFTKTLYLVGKKKVDIHQVVQRIKSEVYDAS